MQFCKSLEKPNGLMFEKFSKSHLFQRSDISVWNQAITVYCTEWSRKNVHLQEGNSVYKWTFFSETC